LPYAPDKAVRTIISAADDLQQHLVCHQGQRRKWHHTVYQVGTAGVLPKGETATLASVPITILPGFPPYAGKRGLVDRFGDAGAFPFGILVSADANTLYVCDEGDGTLAQSRRSTGNVADATSLCHRGVQKWSLVNGTMEHGLRSAGRPDIGVPYGVETTDGAEPANPAVCRGIVR